ncbi:MAG: AAA family ATPase [Chloroflexota bacterium]
MKVTRISKIEGHRVFREFTWPADLRSFGQFNLIYGWNGSGKTTLSSLFGHLQTRSGVAQGNVEFEIDGAKVSGHDLVTARLPTVRVFNRDFIASTIVAAGERMDPIYYFGEDSVEKQKQVEKLKDELVRAEKEVARVRTEKSRAENALDDLCINKARVIKELLISSHAPKYNNYDKRLFKQTIAQQTEASAAAALLPDDDKEKLRKQKDAQPRDTVPGVAVQVTEFDGLAIEAEVLLQRSVVSQVIDELVGDGEVGAWVQKGLALHSGDRKTDKCRFCDQPLPAARVHRLEAHFNEAFASFQSEVAALANRVESERERLAAVLFPDPARLYDHLEPELQEATSQARRMLEEASAYLNVLREVLLRKRESPFERMSSESALQGTSRPDRAALIRVIQAVNEAIEKHNETTTDFANKVKEACEALERSYAAEAFAQYRLLSDAVTDAESALQAVSNNPPILKTRIEAIEREIVEHRRPAEELNAELRSYLGHDELHLDVKDAGYAMTRGGQPAGDLSESEKTAIAFLYFLKSLQDRSFDLANSVILIDDPVSSLDANSLFSAFGYMKERTQGAGQLFVLTHNFGFFRLVKYWFHHLHNQKKKNPDLRPARFYLLKAYTVAGRRTASLGPMDPLLEHYESEYHYLFKRVHAEVHRADAQVMLEEYYGMPNLARRLVETFLAFRYPAMQGDLFKQMEEVDFDAKKKTRILRFLHTYSHSGSIAEPEHDPSILSETRSVLGEVLELIEKCDPVHYKGMISIVATAEGEGDDG